MLRDMAEDGGACSIKKKGGGGMAKAGCHPKYATVEEMQAVIDQYFEDCKGEPIIGDDGMPILDKYGQPFIINQRPPTVTGLALALGFTSRQALLNYQAKKGFVDTVTRAKARIEAYAEERLFDRDGQRGAEFSLRYNFRWVNDEKKDDGGESVCGVAELPAVMPAPQDAGGDANGEA